jgi:hypothetical protein
MKIIDIVDITNKLKTIENEFVFNPSICHYYDNIFLCSYRSFLNKDNLHPWESNWKTDLNNDNTNFVLLIYENNTFNIKHRFSENILNFVDCRLIKSKNINEFYAIVSAKLTNKIIIGSKDINITKITGNTEFNCADNCTLQLLYIIKINNNSLIINKPFVLCKNLSSNIEKNWSFWFDNNDMYITYGFGHGPNKKWFSVIKNNIDFINMKTKNLEYCEPVNISLNKNLDFIKLENIFEGIHFSLSTPSINSKIDNYWISLGHIKINKTKVYNNECINKFVNFMNDNCKIHNIYYYACFFYKFIKDNNKFKIIGVSKLFVFLSL